MGRLCCHCLPRQCNVSMYGKTVYHSELYEY